MIRLPFFKFMHLVNLSMLATFLLVTFTAPPPIDLAPYLQEIKEQRTTIEETALLYNDTLTQLQAYEATEADLMAIGASSEQAQAIISASNLYHISPKR